MTLDKDDLFRNATPGFVFMIVILSFKIANSDFRSLDETSKLLLSIAVAFPAGFIFIKKKINLSSEFATIPN